MSELENLSIAVAQMSQSFSCCHAAGEQEAEERPLTKRQRKRAKQLEEERIRTAEQRQLSQPAPESALEFERLVCFLTLSLQLSPLIWTLIFGYRLDWMTLLSIPLSKLTQHALSTLTSLARWASSCCCYPCHSHIQ